MFLRSGMGHSSFMSTTTKFKYGGNHLHLDILHEQSDDMNGDGCRIEHFVVQWVDTKMLPMAPKFILVRSHESTATEIDGDGSPLLDSFWVSDREMLGVWATGTGIIVQFFESPQSNTDTSTPLPPSILWSGDTGDEMFDAKFCPWSGRLCLIEPTNRSQIRVIDFLLPPP